MHCSLFEKYDMTVCVLAAGPCVCVCVCVCVIVSLCVVHVVCDCPANEARHSEPPRQGFGGDAGRLD